MMTSIERQAIRIDTYMPSPTKPKVSDDPDDYHSHFTQLTPKTSKGQARYRCVTCGHEFSCSGKRRKLQHILGREFLLGKCKNRNVVPCPNPHEPLKRALLRLCCVDGSESGMSRTTSGLVPARPVSHLAQTLPTTEATNHFDQQLHDDSEFNSVIQEILSWGNDHASDSSFDPNNQSFYSNASESSGDEGDMPSPKRIRSGYNLFSPNTSFYSQAPTATSSFSSACPSPYTVPNTPKRAPLSFAQTPIQLETPSYSAPSSFYIPSNTTSEQQRQPIFEELPKPAQQQQPMISQAIFNFFNAYQIPLSAMESPAFQELVQHVQLDDTINKEVNLQVDMIHFSQ